jgi:hypothetical protein
MKKYRMTLLLVSILMIICACTKDTTVRVPVIAEEGKTPCWKTLCIGLGADKTLVVSLLEGIPGTSNIRENIETNEVSFLWEDPANNNTRIGGTVYLNQWHIQAIDLITGRRFNS